MKCLGRLVRQQDFQAVYRRGRRYGNSSFAIYVLDREGPELRLGISVGRRYGGAVRRNRLRRRIREAMRRLIPLLRGGADVVIVPRAVGEGKEMPLSHLTGELAALLSEAGLLSGWAEDSL